MRMFYNEIREEEYFLDEKELEAEEKVNSLPMVDSNNIDSNNGILLFF